MRSKTSHPGDLNLRTDFDAYVRIKRTDASKLQDEYAKLVEGLQEAADDEDSFVANPGSFAVLFSRRSFPDVGFAVVLPEDLLKEAIPGNIRKAEHFVAFLKRFVEYLKVRGRFDFLLTPNTC